MNCQLDQLDKEDIEEYQKLLSPIVKAIKEMSELTLGDIYIHELYDEYSLKMTLEKDRLGLPVKYQVVHIDQDGLAFLKRLNAKGKPTGQIFTVPRLNQLTQSISGNSFWGNITPPTFHVNRFIPDPEQLDAILLGEKFDPVARKKDLSALYQEIVKHNKKLTVPTGWQKEEEVEKFIRSLRVGDRYWSSPTRFFLIRENHTDYIVVLDSKTNREKTVDSSTLMYTRIYRDQPRSFAQEAKQ